MKMARCNIVSFLLFYLYGCANCNCEFNSDLSGYYSCIRESDQYKEFLVLNKKGWYIHIFDYDSITYLNCNQWEVNRKNRLHLFTAFNWVRPCKEFYSECFNKMNYVHSKNYENYLSQNEDFHFACYKGILDKRCLFRLYSFEFQLYNYAKIEEEFNLDQLKEMKIKFFSKSDSLNYIDFLRIN